MVAPVGSRRLDAVGREDLAGVEGHDRDLGLIDDGEDPPSGVGAPTLRWYRRPARRRVIAPFLSAVS